MQSMPLRRQADNFARNVCMPWMMLICRERAADVKDISERVHRYSLQELQ